MNKFRNSLLKASFLHDDEWDPEAELADSFRGLDSSEPSTSTIGASSRSNTRRTNRSNRNVLNTIDSSDDDADDVSSSNEDTGASTSDVTQERRCSLQKFRNPSVSTISASNNSLQKSETPHELAARISKLVKKQFADNLPPALEAEYGNRDTIAPFSTNEIVLGPLLGSGEFSHVYEIKGFRPSSPLETKLTPEEIETRAHMKKRERYHDTKKACYAVKHLRPTLLDKYGRLDYAQSAADLALEAEFLGSLSHPNIIKLRGISLEGAGGFAKGEFVERYIYYEMCCVAFLCAHM